jgi:ADP-ribose pyrophosphatase YjhB (NUDIX family)
MQAFSGAIWRWVPVAVRRRLVHMLVPTFTVGVSGVVLDEAGRVLLLRHRFRESSGWELPGGFLSRSENLEEALGRELREETGLEIEVGRLVRAGTRAGLHVDLCYVARVTGDTAMVPNAEILEAKFFSIDQLPALTADQSRSLRAALREGPNAPAP